MRKIGVYIIGMVWAASVYAQSLPSVMEDICNQLVEQGAIEGESSVLADVMADLQMIASHPIDLNHTSAAELQTLRFLSEDQIDAILLYAYQHPFHSVAELQMIVSLREWDVRNLLPFVTVSEVSEQQPLYFKEVFARANHEFTLRTDARNMEAYSGTDPVYAKWRYRFNFRRRVQAGVTLCRPAGQPMDKLQYGGFIQVQDIGVLQDLVAGNYQASFGQGLVVGSPFAIRKSSYILSGSMVQDGLRKFASVGDDYESFHGAGATVRLGEAKVSAWYSLQKDNLTFHHAIGTNVDYVFSNAQVGVTVLENVYSDSTAAQAVVGAHCRYHRGRIAAWGEVAATQGTRWGVGTLIGVRFTPIENIGMVALYRYYSSVFYSPYGNAFSAHTYMRDENGFYLGGECTRWAYWRLAMYGDAFRDGYDVLLQGDWTPNSPYYMTWRARAKRLNEKTTLSFRYQWDYTQNGWHFRTQLDINGVNQNSSWKGGGSVYQDIAYTFVKVPIVLQGRIQVFSAREWDNRIYMYENDVLYAYSIPFVYGEGIRFWVNARYRINDTFSLYCRWSETALSQEWATAHDKAAWRSDVHVLLRVKL